MESKDLKAEIEVKEKKKGMKELKSPII